MLQVPHIRENREAVIAGLKKKRFNDAEGAIEAILKAEAERVEAQGERDRLQAEANSKAKQIGALMKSGQREQAEAIKAETSELKGQVKHFSERHDAAIAKLRELLVNVPNVPHESVPEGAGADYNVVVHEKGQKPSLSKDAKAHWDLVGDNLLDFERGNKVTGAGFPFYKGQVARLQRALQNFCLDRAFEAGYLEVQPPILVNEASGFGTGQLPDKEGQMYHVTAENFYLIPTAEVPLTNMLRDEIVEEADLPIKLTGYTPCFRREAGSWGAHVRGLNRLHQFGKVEIVQIVSPEASYEVIEEMCAHVESLLDALELPYRKLLLCGGDISFNAALCYDYEVYSAGQGRWLEVSSVSNFETYQANRLQLRSRSGKQKQLVHTLNGSALPMPRVVAGLLENNQADGYVRIPEVLQPYCGFDRIEL